MPESRNKHKTTTESRDVLTAEEAKERATDSIAELQLTEEPGYGLLSDPNLEISDPLLTIIGALPGAIGMAYESWGWAGIPLLTWPPPCHCSHSSSATRPPGTTFPGSVR